MACPAFWEEVRGLGSMVKAIAQVLGLLAIVVAAEGCAPSRMEASGITPLKDGTYQFFANAGVLQRESDARAERERMEWLQEALDENGFCKRGFDVTDRRTVVHHPLGTTVHSIFYDVRCK